MSSGFSSAFPLGHWRLPFSPWFKVFVLGSEVYGLGDYNAGVSFHLLSEVVLLRSIFDCSLLVLLHICCMHHHLGLSLGREYVCGHPGTAQCTQQSGA